MDVGGGIGTSSLQIARAFPKVKTIVQDFPEVIAQAETVRYYRFVYDLQKLIALVLFSSGAQNTPRL